MSNVKIVKSREGLLMQGEGITNPTYSGDPALVITGISQEVYDLIEQDMLWWGHPVTVIAPDISDSTGECVFVDLDGGDPFSVHISRLTPIPETKTVTVGDE